MHLLSQPLASLTGLDIGLIFGLAGLIFAGVFGVLGMYFHHRKQALWHETARLALEKGQPLPAPPPADESVPKNPRREAIDDLRSGLVLIAVGIGLFIFLSRFIGPGLAAVGAIPGFIGIALLLYGGARLLFGAKAAPDSTPAPRS